MARSCLSVVSALYLLLVLAASTKLAHRNFSHQGLLPAHGGEACRPQNLLMTETAGVEAQKILFAFVAYIPDMRNCDLLQKTTHNAAVFHPHDSIIVVIDNGSPISAAQCVDTDRVIVMQGPKAREMGAWILVQEHIEQWKPTHVAVLQHSIIVTSRFNVQAMACPVVSLTHWPTWDKASLDSLATVGTIGPGSTPRMEWTSAMATCMNIHCSTPCAQAGPITQQPLLRWGIAFDSASVWSIDAWKSLTTMGLWNCMKLDRPYGKSESQQFERFVGVLMAKAGYPVDRCHANLGTFVQKVHGGTSFLRCASGVWAAFDV
eukprot:TRINITY_DN5691_c0_g1_i1.p1 TRINITY_DN5691_c0_g1~~TRINITY_DN5691_c0_g1_i1.p1  ORF type:complete len:319 (-),score=32.41 TRINITY_DN5691_c0_g1_i1:32-988(-)